MIDSATDESGHSMPPLPPREKRHNAAGSTSAAGSPDAKMSWWRSLFAQRADRTDKASHHDERLVNISEYETLVRHNVFVQRVWWVTAVLLVLALAGWALETSKEHVEVAVYHENDPTGDIKLMGMASRTAAVTPKTVVKELTDFIKAYRMIPAGNGVNNLPLINENAAEVECKIQARSPALATYLAALRQDNPPKASRDGTVRTVTQAEVDTVADLTYRITWKELLSTGGDKPVESTWSGNVTLFQKPSPPAGPQGNCNPAGLFIYSTNFSQVN